MLQKPCCMGKLSICVSLILARKGWKAKSCYGDHVWPQSLCMAHILWILWSSKWHYHLGLKIASQSILWRFIFHLRFFLSNWWWEFWSYLGTGWFNLPMYCLLCQIINSTKLMMMKQYFHCGKRQSERTWAVFENVHLSTSTSSCSTCQDDIMLIVPLLSLECGVLVTINQEWCSLAICFPLLHWAGLDVVHA